LVAPLVFVGAATAGADIVNFIAATQTNTQSTVTGTERNYGAGSLAAAVSAGATSLTVTTEEGSTRPIFVNSDKIRISNGTTTDIVDLAAVGVSYVGLVATLTLLSGQSLVNAYSAGAVVSSIYALGNVSAATTGYTITSAAGTFNSATYPIAPSSIGSVQQTWTLAFTSATAFTITGDTEGSVGSGVITSNFAPTNPGFTSPYFTLDYRAFGGTWASGDTLQFTTAPCAIPVFVSQRVPAGTAATPANNGFELRIRTGAT
jgi:hypothetical protein